MAGFLLLLAWLGRWTERGCMDGVTYPSWCKAQSARLSSEVVRSCVHHLVRRLPLIEETSAHGTITFIVSCRSKPTEFASRELVLRSSPKAAVHSYVMFCIRNEPQNGHEARLQVEAL